MRLQFGSRSSSRGDGRSAAGKGCLTVFFLVFLLMGAAFTVVVVIETVRVTAVWFWPEVPCTVLASGVEETGDDSDPYRPSVLFEYELDGRHYRSTRVRRGDITTSSYDKARGPSDRYPPGAEATCRINPDRPDEAVLEPHPPVIGFVALFPLIFVAVGAGGIFFTWKGPPAVFQPTVGDSISQRARDSRGMGRRIGLGVGLVFTAVGGGLSIFLLVIPVARLAVAVTWIEIPAVVVDSTVRSWATDDGTSYRADVLYEYAAAGRTWRSNRRSFFPLGSSDYSDQKATADRYPAGAAISCFVDPDDPSRSILDRRPRPVYLIGLFPLVFLLAGAALTTYVLRSGRSPTPPTRAPSESGDRLGSSKTEVQRAERTLEPAAGPVAKVIGVVIVAVIWNGIISVFLWQVVKGFTSGQPEWFLTVFMIPFVLVGLGLVVGIFYTALAAFNPRPKLTISPGSPRLGSRLHLDWTFRGQAGRINHLEIVLEGHEKASYRRGTDTHTDREAFASVVLVKTSSEMEIARGSTDVDIPADTMHSFVSHNNAIVWSLNVHGDIARWPDVMEDFEIEVRPLARERLLPR